MNEVKHLAEQHRRALEGGAWHGPALLEVLRGVTAKRAAERPIRTVHSIWEILLHIEAWDRVVLGRLTGHPIDLSDEENWPDVRDVSPAAWRRAVASMKSTHQKLNRQIAKLTPARLDIGYGPRKRYKMFRLVHGVVHHELYHAGQIAILKKG
ncbi:MAG TPA: DinB family protein [Candidatus Dormibacteraeota bacterium]|nr:DinB family protein [Candidatus Dormibacteraeota bacterium]